MRNFIKTDEMVEKSLLEQMAKKYSYFPIGKFYNCNKKIG